ncbi:unnamed protein product [Cylindrotheca closterium]|uniref:Uncharacterized protein n=1 Tax=Cylindrotheca closterium TaxID=2856 RepID=A0AAD2G1U6_9STRA|nr:unnamed protein product [Cylindrotheca closterium]
MSQPLYRNGKNRSSTPNYGSVSGKKSSLSSSIEEGQPLIAHSPSSDASSENLPYPKATDEQRELLLLIESEIKFARQSKFHIVLPRLTEKRVQKLRTKINRVNTTFTLDTTGCDGFVFSFLRSTLFYLFLTLLVTIIVLIGIDKWNFGLFNTDDAFKTFIQEGFPFVTVMFSVIACVGPTMHRLTPFSQEVGSYASPSSLKEAAKEGIEDMVVMISSRVDNVNAKLTSVLDHMRHVSDRAYRFQYKIRLVDPEVLDRHDVLNNPYLDAEREIQNAKEEIHAKMLTFEQDISFDVASWIPSYLSSPRKFFKVDMFGHMVLLLLLHLVGILSAIAIVESRVSMDIQVQFLSTMMSYLAMIPYFEELSQRLTPFIICWISALLLESYLISSFFLTNIYFSKSSCSRTVSVINDLRSVITSHTNWLLMQNGVIFLSHDILEVRMNQLRLKVIELVEQNHNLCSALSLADIDDSSMSGEEGDDKVLTNFPFQSPTAAASVYSHISKKNSMTPGSVVSYQPSIDPPEDKPTSSTRPPASDSPPQSEPVE